MSSCGTYPSSRLRHRSWHTSPRHGSLPFRSLPVAERREHREAWSCRRRLVRLRRQIGREIRSEKFPRELERRGRISRDRGPQRVHRSCRLSLAGSARQRKAKRANAQEESPTISSSALNNRPLRNGPLRLPQVFHMPARGGFVQDGVPSRDGSIWKNRIGFGAPSENESVAQRNGREVA